MWKIIVQYSFKLQKVLGILPQLGSFHAIMMKDVYTPKLSPVLRGLIFQIHITNSL